MGREAVFAGLVVDEYDQPVTVTRVGPDAYYVVDDQGFQRHIPSDYVDRQVLMTMQETVLSNREAVVEAMLSYLGRDDLFTKAAIEASLGQMGEQMEQLMTQGLPEAARQWLGLMGFKVVVDIHGDVVDLEMPGVVEEGE
ncbi:MAG TPA: hypothetical protein ENL34_02095 [Chloroflexi bacterium]|nr:hypothetical protein [Chloroflexota bacterium]